MDSIQILIVNAQVFCLLALIIPCFSGALYTLFLRRSPHGMWRMLGGLCLLSIALGSLNVAYNLIVQAQDINSECVGHSDARYKDCSYDGSLSSTEEQALQRADIFWDTMECIVVPTIIGVSASIYIMNALLRRYVHPIAITSHKQEQP